MPRIILLAIAFLALACSAPFEDDEPVMAYELDGQWCTVGDVPQVCLTVVQAPGHVAYVWQAGLCFEHGRLTGGLEFTPNTDSRLCVAPEFDLYSATGVWTGTGLRLTVDASPGDDRASGLITHSTTYELAYQPNP